MRFALIVALGLAFGPVTAQAQDAQTLADVRQELTVLNVEVQKLRRELSTSGSASVAVTGGSVLERVNAMESELQRLTSKTEELENQINRVVTDGTNRIGDLEFRLVELEGGDVGNLGQTSTLGGGEMPATMAPATPVPAPVDPLTSNSTTTNTAELAVGEKTDFERAKAALADGDFRTAADQFAAFNQTYPGGPLGPEADLRRGDALDGLGDTREAARAYLASFSTDPNGPVAAEALYQLGSSLGALGQTQEACVTLGEVASRFPTSPFVAQAQSERSVLACQ
ncbi:MAG: tol-pal system protein YbgF [Sulfitobacter litoralis]|jgi:tol-pal system protein YbgF|uniref:Cell division coordinator CpoB n=2 Tax=root TaxID=1 RepID=A0A1H0REG7_9RHOB|nr:MULTISPECIES: tol-pal system protein YbgF [Sulfitobacter]MBQ0717279.1 tol-pal system protein YbgF [Sulfitobacter litoralis]MBQ0767101.1 tol-pal system protein YbgF [Sulfitobacter litoralis]MBQ0802090.1 tol-pal system protein YbgF [Sulfitobacter litoralis]MCF7726907.1 tol-pal system protein YbgF [Sulfitobacter sp. M22]MCF7778285.1 tol-pal system protein YbgF [Sulfitobacter sp. M220]|tara:strand:+ start:1407 stop:2258 length:852 start_codon:yes stop_codon:yes gene_type:complete